MDGLTGAVLTSAFLLGRNRSDGIADMFLKAIQEIHTKEEWDMLKRYINHGSFL